MVLKEIRELNPAEELAVIINVKTKLMTTLALLSTLRHASVPVLLLECDSKDGSFEHFSRLQSDYRFDLLKAPLRTHGETLDWLFQNISARKVLLVDSDLEILSPEIIQFFRQFIDHERTFGGGFTNGPGYLTDHGGTFLEEAYYQERIWLPLAMLKTTFVREALANGHSFRDRTVYNDFTPSARISAKIARLRHRHPKIRKWGWRAPACFRQTYNGHKPSVVYCDTGADMYQYLRYKRELLFAGLSEQYHARYVTHFFGSSRNALNEKGPHAGNRHESNMAAVNHRLKEIYGFDSQMVHH